jgi:hypothetical protein
MHAPLLARSKPASPRLLASMVVLFLGLGIGGVWWFVSKAASNVAADLNNDAKVDVLDLSALLTNWAGTGTSTRGDINSDSAVNIFDLSLLLAGWGSNSTATIPAGGALVTIDAASNGGAWKVALSFGHFWSDGVNEPTQNAASYVKWAAYNPPPVRVSTRRYPTGGHPKLNGVWNFAHLDTMITIDRQSSQAAPMLNLSELPEDIPCDRSNAGLTVMGQYFARLVSYYNKGSMVTETGTTITNPHGTANKITYWELFNEPSIMPDCGLMTPDEYASMFNVAAPLMKAVDPTIKIMGPVDNEHNSTSHDYISTLMAIANKPDIISTHHYAGNNSRSDHYLMTSLAPGGEIWGQLERAYQVAPDRPHWVTEANISWESNQDPAGRPWGALGQVWNAELFRIAAQFGVELIQTYNWSEQPQFGMINRSSGVTNLSYWRNLLIHRYFPAGTTTLNTSTTMPDGITSMAVKEADGTVNILLINKRLENTTVNGGTGIATDVALSVRGKSIQSITMQKIDASSSATTEPPVVSLSTTDPVVQFSGYGIALIKID